MSGGIGSPSSTEPLAGKPVNMITALAIARALKAYPARPELEELLPDLRGDLPLKDD